MKRSNKKDKNCFNKLTFSFVFIEREGDGGPLRPVLAKPLLGPVLEVIVHA